MPTVAAGALLLLWYKRMMIAMPDEWQATFLVACAAGFVACGFALDRLRTGAWAGVGLDSRRIAALSSLVAAVASLGCLIGGAWGAALACIGGLAAAAAFLAVLASGMRALPYDLRGCAFAAVFFCAGLVNTSTDLAELPWLLVAGTAPNAVFACTRAAAAAAVAAALGTAFDTRVQAVPEDRDGHAPAMTRLFLLTTGCFMLMYVAVSLKDSVAYPVAVESISSSGLIRYVELPMWVVAGLACDRVGRRELFAFCTLCAFVGSASLVAQPGSSAAALCVLCSYFCLIGFPTACVCLVVDVSRYLARPALAGVFCFAPVLVGAGVSAWTSSVAGEAASDVLFLASIACLTLFAALATLLLRDVGAYQDLLQATPVIELPGVSHKRPDAGEVAELYGLTRRETEVLGLVFKGLTIQQMADELVVSKSTVKFHVTNILRKTGSENREQMVEMLESQGTGGTASA